MFAVDHALTALLIKRRYRAAPLAPILLSVQAMELTWVALNYGGIERTDAEAQVRSVADIHLSYMPYSHSVATACAAAALAWWTLTRLDRPILARAVGIGVLSHLVLDLATHARDIALTPGMAIAFGSGLYERAPGAALAIELLFAVFCVWIYARGRHEVAARSLYAFAIVGNLLNASFLSAAIAGPEELLGGHPLLVVSVVFVQIVLTLWIVYRLAGGDDRAPSGDGRTPTSAG
jgi:membrane-bound metal-dependent hydrolase YbcI (DUF457 family)